MTPPDLDRWDETRAQLVFGALTGAGYSPPFTVTANAEIYVWGIWPALDLNVERSTDSGVTWKDCNRALSGASLSVFYSTPMQLSSATVSGAALYRLRIDPPFIGGCVNFSVHQ